MTELTNSQRRIYTSTYAPIEIEDNPDDVEKLRMIRRTWEKASFIRSLAIRQPEVASLIEQVKELEIDEEQQLEVLKALDVVARLILDPTPTGLQKQAQQLGDIDYRLLSSIGRLLARSRYEIGHQVEDALAGIRARYEQASLNEGNFRQLNRTMAAEDRPRVFATPSSEIAARNPDEATQELEDTAVTRRAASFQPTGDRSAPALEQALAWAQVFDAERFNLLHSLAHSFSPLPAAYSKLSSTSQITGLLGGVFAWGRWTEEVVDGFEEHMKITPIGRLHLERLQMTPVGVERGELVYSLPLAPRETVNISHREWSLRSEEFERLVQDEFEEFSEQGVTEKNDLSQSTTSQSTHSETFSLSGSGSYCGFSATVGFDSTSGDSKTQSDSRNRAIELTRKASSRTRKEHKHSFKVSAVAGTEDLSVRVITNPSDTNATRIDYYGMMRKWRVDLFRYGLRLTYDIAIPNPGSELVEQIKEIRRLDALIEQPFNFKLPLTSITRLNWDSLAGTFQATVEPPPEENDSIHVPPKIYTDDTRNFFDSLEFEVDPDYEVDFARLRARFDPDNAQREDVLFDVLHPDTSPPARFSPLDATQEARLIYSSSLPHLTGRSGRLVVVFVGQELREGAVFLEVNLRLKEEAFKRWRFRTWNALREAAEEKYYADRQLLIDRRSVLLEELGRLDALSLRQMEREAVMKAVLRWLFGPDFEFIPPDVQNLFGNSDPNDPASQDVLNPNSLSNQQWGRVLGWGEFIKYIQQAIEWENMVYFTYPYFWDSPRNWDLKRFLHHPDLLHRTFLRAGSARVVLTIRPGFESSFVSLVETGAFGELPGNHPYITIAEEIKNFAMTNYPGIPPANPADPDNEEQVFANEQGKLIGRWHEYTPTSALDIALNTPPGDIA